MPLPEPEKGETKDHFIARCVSHPQANEDFPVEHIRLGFCFGAWERGREAVREERAIESEMEDAELLVESCDPVSTDEQRAIARLLGGETADHREEVSRPMRAFAELGLLQGDVLDFGAGQDLHEFARWDPVHSPDPAPLSRRYDVVCLNHVLNVIPIEALRTEALIAARGLLKPGGRILVAIWQKPAEHAAAEEAKGYQSGWSKERWGEFLSELWEVEPVAVPGVLAFQLTERTEEESRVKEAVDTAARSELHRIIRWTQPPEPVE